MAVGRASGPSTRGFELLVRLEHRRGQRVDRKPVVRVRAAAAHDAVREPAGADWSAPMTRSRETAAARNGECRRLRARRRKHERWEWWQIGARRFAAELVSECQLLEQRALLPAVYLDRVVVGQRSDQAGDPGAQLEREMRGGAGRELTSVADGCASGEAVGLLGFRPCPRRLARGASAPVSYTHLTLPTKA